MKSKYANIAVILILAFTAVLSFGTMLGESAIMDEVAHIPAGYTYLKFHDYRLNPEHPPLLKDLAGLPLQFLQLNFPKDESFWTESANGQWDAGWRFIYMNDAHQVLFWSRLPILILALVTGFFIYWWTKKLFGVIAAIIAVSIYAFDPNIIAHNHYVTTDLGIAAFCLFSFFFFINYLKNPNWKNIILSGVFLGLAQLAKFSAILLIPVYVVTLILYALFRKEKLPKVLTFLQKTKKRILVNLSVYLVSFFVVGIVCLSVIWIVYEANIYKMPPEKIHQLIDTQFYQQNKVQMSFAPFIHKMADYQITKPLSQYLLGLLMVLGRVEGGNTTYFFGQVTNQSFRSYFPLVFLIKEPIPNLLLMFSSLAIGLYLSFKSILLRYKKSKNTLKALAGSFKSYVIEKTAEFSMLCFIALYLYTSITGNLNIGFRHLFPILPFIYILTAKELSFVLENTRKLKNLAVRLFIIAMLCLLSAATLLSYPYYLAYFNELVGGSKNGYKYVTDSNVDWGQDLKRLSQWVEKNNIDKIRIDYFGGGDVKYYLGDRAILWHSHYPKENGWYAISATFLQNSIYYKIKDGTPDYDWLRSRPPAEMIGNSIMIYHITEI